MLYSKKTDYLMESIRLGREMDRREKLNLIVGLSIPSMLAQISTVMMFFIDASMVGHLGAEASASIGLIESTTWLIGSLLSAAATGFSVQVPILSELMILQMPVRCFAMRWFAVWRSAFLFLFSVSAFILICLIGWVEVLI